jgi:hypothetical protein
MPRLQETGAYEQESSMSRTLYSNKTLRVLSAHTGECNMSQAHRATEMRRQEQVRRYVRRVVVGQHVTESKSTMCLYQEVRKSQLQTSRHAAL